MLLTSLCLVVRILLVISYVSVRTVFVFTLSGCCFLGLNFVCFA